MAREKGQAKEGARHPQNGLNDLTGNAWMFFTKTVLQTSFPSELGHDLRRRHYANKPPRLMQQIIEFFTRRGDRVLDPFAGVGGTSPRRRLVWPHCDRHRTRTRVARYLPAGSA